MFNGRSRPEGLIFSIQRFCTQDGPGIRTTVFMKGCPLLCPWCHNPEGISLDLELITLDRRCIRCGACLDVCPQQPAGPGGDTGKSNCELCGQCVEACPVEAREIVGRPIAADALLDEILKDRIFFEDSGGGVTFSGGEPLLQPAFLHRSFTLCRQHSIHTALDTSGFAQPEVFLASASQADLVLFDLKHMDRTRHEELTGVSNELILTNLATLGKGHHTVWLRIPVIPGYNDDGENIRAMAELARSIPSIRKICLIPFHRPGTGKFKGLGRSYPLDTVSEPSQTHLETLAGMFQCAGVEVTVGG